MGQRLPPAAGDELLDDDRAMTEERIAQIAKALSHPARIRILEQFDGSRPHIAKDIVGECKLAQSTVSEHLRILREANLLVGRRDGPRTWYFVRPSVLGRFAAAVEDLVGDHATAGHV